MTSKSSITFLHNHSCFLSICLWPIYSSQTGFLALSQISICSFLYFHLFCCLLVSVFSEFYPTIEVQRSRLTTPWFGNLGWTQLGSFSADLGWDHSCICSCSERISIQDLQDKLFFCPDNFPLGNTCIFREQEYSSHKPLETDLLFFFLFFFFLHIESLRHLTFIEKGHFDSFLKLFNFEIDINPSPQIKCFLTLFFLNNSGCQHQLNLNLSSFCSLSPL